MPSKPPPAARRALLLALLAAAAAGQARGGARAETLPLRVLFRLFDDDRALARDTLQRLGAGWQDGYAAPLLELVGFLPDRELQQGVLALLDRAAGRPMGTDLNRRYEWLWSRTPEPHPDYAEFKAALYGQIDARFREYFANDRPASIRLDEIRWGGVERDGIPPLKNPKMVEAGAAGYLSASNIVFGIAVDGDVRAYPKRILAWHEMFKDRIAGRELTGVYCTLCGAMILYDSQAGGRHHELGTSGFLYRSNKLMYDHATKSLWSTMEGTPVVGPLVGQGLELTPLHVVTTTWGAWKARHPRTRVLSLDTGHRRDYAEGAAYREYFASDRLMFNVPRLDDRLPNKAEVLALRFPAAPGETLAIAADFLLAQRVHHDRVGAQAVVVLTDASGANRVYDPQELRFVGWDGQRRLRDSAGHDWQVGEAALEGPGGRRLPRLAAHRAFWFGWYAAYPQTRLVK